MQKIRKKYSFMARRRIDEKDENCVPLKSKNYYEYFYISENVLYCSNCKKMSRMCDFYTLKDGEISKDKLKKYVYSNYDIASISDVIDIMAKSNSKTYLYKTMGLEDENDILHFEMKLKNMPKLTCPKCGKEIYFKDIKKLSRANGWKIDNSYVHAYEVKEQENKIILSVFIYTVFPVTQVGKLKFSEINVRIIFNKDTKIVYMMQPIYTKTMKPVFKGEKTKRLINITYMSDVENFITYLGEIAIKDRNVLNYLAKYMCKQYGDKKEDIFDKNFDFKSIVYYFRYNHMSNKEREIIKYLCGNSRCLTKAKRQKKKRLLQEIYLAQSSPEELSALMKKKKCPNKKRLKKMIVKNIFVIYIYKFLVKLGMKDYNVILDIIEDSNADTLTNYIYIFTELLREQELAVHTKTFLKNFIKEKGDIQTKKLVFDKIKNSTHEMCVLYDSARLYHLISEAILGENIPFPVEFCALQEMHDLMSSALSKFKHRNKKILYKIEDFKLCGTIGEYLFILPTDTYSLIDCGEKMGICVGAYGDKVTGNKKCIIVFMMKDNKYIGCIEITENKKNLVQAKSRFNGLITGEAALALKNWVEINKISVESCYDYQHIANGNLDYNEYQYGHYNFATTTHFNNLDEINKNIFFDMEYLVIEKDKPEPVVKKIEQKDFTDYNQFLLEKNEHQHISEFQINQKESDIEYYETAEDFQNIE